MKKRFYYAAAAMLALFLIIPGCGKKEAKDQAANEAEQEEASESENSEALEKGEYSFTCRTSEGEQVEGVKLQVCTDEACQLLTTDAEGNASFTGEDNEYEVHVLKVPKGYSLISDEAFSLESDTASYEVVFEKE